MKVIVFGGDGFCGWPSALELSSRGHQVTIVDNFVRRRMDDELGVQSLTPIHSLGERLRSWTEVTGLTVDAAEFNLASDYRALTELLAQVQPDAVVHFAEQRAAPYSMKTADHKRYTVDNNINTTHNLLAAIVELGLDTHVVHLGTMGVYGYDTAPIDLPEGYFDISFVDRDGDTHDRQILYPTKPGSVYHLTKSLDQLLFEFYVRNDGLRITDLHQGIVWGTQTTQTRLDERLINRFDYDGDFGTVLNRFLVQAALGIPLTVHGTGGQTRAFINIQDTVTCVRLAVESGDAVGGRVRVMNQITETHCIRDLAQLVSRVTGAEVAEIPNPRNEAEKNDLHARNDRLLDLGLDPILLETGLLDESLTIAKKYSDRADLSRIPCVSYWNDARRSAAGTR